MPSAFARVSLTGGIVTVWAAALLGQASPNPAPQALSPAVLLEDYRARDAESAVRAVSALGEPAVRELIRQEGDPRDPWAAAALALLHAEAAYRVDAIAPDGRLSAMRGLHLSREYDLIEKRACRSGAFASDAALAAFCRAWSKLRPMEEVARRFPDDVAVLVARGAAKDRYMGPTPQPYAVGQTYVDARWYPESGCPVPTSAGCLGTSAYEALQLFTRALDIAPAAVEARVRRARVLAALERTGDAERDLLRAADEARDSRDRTHHYLALLLLGQLSERAGRLDVALERYRAARGVAPEFPVAALAIARLRVLSGDRAAAAAADLAHTLAPDPESGEIGPADPWVTFTRGPDARQMAAALAALREAVRR